MAVLYFYIFPKCLCPTYCYYMYKFIVLTKRLLLGGFSLWLTWFTLDYCSHMIKNHRLSYFVSDD